MSWVAGAIRSTNAAARVLRGGPVKLGTNVLSDMASELCTFYWGLLIDPSFRRDIESAAQVQSEQWSAILDYKDDMDCHFNAAIALLAEAGLDGEAAAEAVRSLKANFASLQELRSDHFFQQLREVKRAVCELNGRLLLEIEEERKEVRLRRITRAGVGLSLIGVSAAALAVASATTLLAPAAVATAAGWGILSAIGSRLFETNAEP
jgi:hypothetical protein